MSDQVKPRAQRSVIALGARPVIEVMSRPVVCIRGRSSLAEALDGLVRSGRRHLVVVDDDDRCVGVLADRIVAAVWANDPTRLSRVQVAAVLDDPPAVLGMTGTVGDAARLMKASASDAVTVVDRHDVPVGIVTATDLVALLAA